MMFSGRRIVAWLSDFGSGDGYVAAMQATTLSIHPDLTLVDISHEIRPGDIDQAGFVLSQCYDFFPLQTIFVCVVDPGVGGDRKILLVETDRHTFMAPDNGLLKYVLHQQKEAVVRCLDIAAVSRQPCSSTFHGRDIMAPAAGLLASGTPGAAIAQPFNDYDRGRDVMAKRHGALIYGRIIHVDRFGNCISNIPGAWLASGAVAVRIGDLAEMAVHRFYGDVPPGEPICLIGSHGYLEFAVRDGHAAQRHGIRHGDPVTAVVHTAQN